MSSRHGLSALLPFVWVVLPPSLILHPDRKHMSETESFIYLSPSTLDVRVFLQPPARASSSIPCRLHCSPSITCGLLVAVRRWRGHQDIGLFEALGFEDLQLPLWFLPLRRRGNGVLPLPRLRLALNVSGGCVSRPLHPRVFVGVLGNEISSPHV